MFTVVRDPSAGRSLGCAPADWTRQRAIVQDIARHCTASSGSACTKLQATFRREAVPGEALQRPGPAEAPRPKYTVSDPTDQGHRPDTGQSLRRLTRPPSLPEGIFTIIMVHVGIALGQHPTGRRRKHSGGRVHVDRGRVDKSLRRTLCCPGATRIRPGGCQAGTGYPEAHNCLPPKALHRAQGARR